MTPPDRSTYLTYVLGALIVISLAGIVYMAFTPQASADPYTEFYILGPDGNASDYPTNLSVGETGNFIVGVTNHEHESVTYTIELVLNNRTVTTLRPTVEDGETWEQVVSFEPQQVGRHRLDILLYIAPESETDRPPEDTLWLWVEVTNGTGSG